MGKVIRQNTEKLIFTPIVTFLGKSTAHSDRLIFYPSGQGQSTDRDTMRIYITELAGERKRTRYADAVQEEREC